LAGALAVRQIPVGPDTVVATVEGDVEAVDRVLRISRLRVHYTITIPRGTRDAADRAVATHEENCPAATSVRGCIPIVITADIREHERL
jgi:organic hydroperoxide reductase OsmC/OhrA